MAKSRDNFKSFRENQKLAQEYAERLKEIFDASERNSKKITSFINDVESSLNRTQKVQDDIDRIKEDVENNNIVFIQQRESAKEQINAINAFYSEFQNLKSQIDDPNQGMGVSLQESKKVRDKLKAFENQAESLNSSFEQTVGNYNEKAKNLEELLIKITDLFSKATNENDGVQSQLDKVKAIREEVTTTYERIKSFEENITDVGAKVKTLLKNAENDSLSITDIKAKATNTYEEIERIYGQTADTGMAGEFAKRRDEFKDEIETWSTRIYRVTIFLFIVIILLFALPYITAAICDNFCDLKITPDFYLRLAITSPIVYYLYFIAKKHKQSTESYRKYAFKTTLAFSIKNHIDLLARHDKFNKPEHSDQVLNWAIKALDKIYDEPYFDEGKKMKYKIMLEEIRYGLKKEKQPKHKTESEDSKSEAENNEEFGEDEAPNPEI
tara:strand:+ start:24648 stop:25970 length:1323 start_codon:yes stop_codon:yes gene_type:complete